MMTALGQFLRKLRIDQRELMKDMADKLGVSPSFMSSVENGKKSMPSAWNGKICELYSLTEEQQHEFSKAIANSEKSIEVDFSGVSSEGSSLAVSFARKLPTFNESQIKALQKIILERRKR